MDISLLRWPEEQPLRAELAAEGRLRLLLVEADSPPPTCLSPEEDWVRLPASQADIGCRVASLQARNASKFEARVGGRSWPTLDADGLLRNGERWVALSPVDALLAEVLLRSIGSVVSRADLQQAGWPDGEPNENTLDVRIARLRKRLAAVELTLKTVRSRGYLLELSIETSGSCQVVDAEP